MKHREVDYLSQRSYKGVIGTDPISTIMVLKAINARKLKLAEPSLLSRMLQLPSFRWIGGKA